MQWELIVISKYMSLYNHSQYGYEQSSGQGYGLSHERCIGQNINMHEHLDGQMGERSGERYADQSAEQCAEQSVEQQHDLCSRFVYL